jgi:DNA-3-methyladenine glycosylase
MSDSSSKGAQPIGRDFFARSVHLVAPDLVGTTLLVDGVGGTIVEVEAYDHEDPASHGFRGRTARNAAMFGSPGQSYVYRAYGIHWCLNLVCEDEGTAAAVLLRALEPTQGLDCMRARRRTDDLRLLCAGPGRLCEALGVSREQDGLALDEPPFELRHRTSSVEVKAAARIGITRAADRPWRYVLAGSRFLSRAVPRA